MKKDEFIYISVVYSFNVILSIYTQGPVSSLKNKVPEIIL